MLASLSILGVIARMALTFAENMRMLARTREEADTDVLTGLGNRRRLLADLERRLEPGHAANITLVLFDLNGFKQYNDAFGHPAGDALLEPARRQPRRASSPGAATPTGWAATSSASSSRAATSRPEFVIAGAERALREHGDGLRSSARRTASVTLPDEAATVSEALGLADQRMYAQKKAGRADRRGALDAAILLTAIADRARRGRPSTLPGVVELAEALAVKLGLPDRGGRARASSRRSCTTSGRWRSPTRSCTSPARSRTRSGSSSAATRVIAERILLGAPALSHVAGVVRSSREHFDGTGYPDGLSGTEIPLVSRIVFVCDAFDAMTAERPYRPALTIGAALAELERCCGNAVRPARRRRLRRAARRARLAARSTLAAARRRRTDRRSRPGKPAVESTLPSAVIDIAS